MPAVGSIEDSHTLGRPLSALRCPPASGRIRGWGFAVAATVLFALLLTSCAFPEPRTGEMPATLRVGVLPDEERSRLQSRHAPLVEYLSQDLGIPCELVIPETYGELVELFREGKIDLGYFGGFTFASARKQTRAIPLVMRDVDTRFTSYFLARGDDPRRSLEDFRGARVTFGSELSTSGHLMPRYFLHTRGWVPEDFFAEVKFSGTHDETAYWIRDGKADLGAANARVIDRMFADGRLDRSAIRIVWQSSPFPDYVWAIQPSHTPETRAAIRDAFLRLSISDTDHAGILEQQRARGFLPAEEQEFAVLGKAIALLDPGKE